MAKVTPMPDPVARLERAADAAYKKVQEASAARDRARAEHTLKPSTRNQRTLALAEHGYRQARAAWLKSEESYRDAVTGGRR